MRAAEATRDELVRRVRGRALTAASVLGATHNFVDAIKKAVPNWDPAKHPRDREGQFLEVGDYVRAYANKEAVTHEAIGKVAASYYDAPTNRMFIGIDVGNGDLKWYRPKQLENIKVKAKLVPVIPLPALDAKDEHVEWDKYGKTANPDVLGAAEANPSAVSPKVVQYLDPSDALSSGVANAPEGSMTIKEESHAAKLPAGKTPEQALSMLKTHFESKYKANTGIIYPGGVAGYQNDFDKMLADPDFDSASQKLAKLMTAAKLGGKQRKRYLSFLEQKHGGSEEAMEVVGEPKVDAPAPDPEPGVISLEDNKVADTPLADWEKELLDSAPTIPGVPEEWYAAAVLALTEQGWDWDNSGEPVPPAFRAGYDLGLGPADFAHKIFDGESGGGVDGSLFLSNKNGTVVVVSPNADDEWDAVAYYADNTSTWHFETKAEAVAQAGTALDEDLAAHGGDDGEPIITGDPMVDAMNWADGLEGYNAQLYDAWNVDFWTTSDDDEKKGVVKQVVETAQMAEATDGLNDPAVAKAAWKFLAYNYGSTAGKSVTLTDMDKGGVPGFAGMGEFDEPTGELKTPGTYDSAGQLTTDVPGSSAEKVKAHSGLLVDSIADPTILDYIIKDATSSVVPENKASAQQAMLTSFAYDADSPVTIEDLKVAGFDLLAQGDGTEVDPNDPDALLLTAVPGSNPEHVATFLAALQKAKSNPVHLTGVLDTIKSSETEYPDIAASGKQALLESFATDFDTVVNFQTLEEAGVKPQFIKSAGGPVDQVLLNTFIGDLAAGNNLFVESIAADDGSLYEAEKIASAKQALLEYTAQQAEEEAAYGAAPDPAGHEPGPGGVIPDDAPEPPEPPEWPGPPQLSINESVYEHPLGSIIVADNVNGTVTKYKPDGKKASTSATAEKLALGHGTWEYVGSGPKAIDMWNLAHAPAPISTGPSHAKKIAAKKVVAAKKAAPKPKPASYWDQVQALSLTKGINPESLSLADIDAAHAAGVTPAEFIAEHLKPATVDIVQTPQYPTLKLLVTSMANKSVWDSEAAANWDVVVQNGVSYEDAAVALAKLMTKAKLGGKQRKRYKDALAAAHGKVVGSPKMSASKPAGSTKNSWSPVKVPPTNGGPIAGVVGATKGNALVNSGGSAQQAKRTIQDALSDRMKGKVSTQELVSAVLDTDYAYTDEIRGLAKAAKAGGLKPPYKSVQRQTYGNWALSTSPPGGSSKLEPTPENLEFALRSTVANSLIKLWAQTSNDSNVRSLAMQEAAVEEFGLTDTYAWKKGSISAAEIKKELDTQRHLFRTFLRAMHTHTQEWAKQNNVTHVRLKRGSGTYAGPVGSTVKVRLRPMSSFSTNKSTADGFGSNRIDAIVPIEWVVGTAATGFGCQSEYEWVVLGGVHTVRVVS